MYIKDKYQLRTEIYFFICSLLNDTCQRESERKLLIIFQVVFIIELSVFVNE